jgi:hypothetical protein
MGGESDNFTITMQNAPQPTQTQQGKVIFSEQQAHWNGTSAGAARVSWSASTVAFGAVSFASTALNDDLILSDRSLA